MEVQMLIAVKLRHFRAPSAIEASWTSNKN